MISVAENSNKFPKTRFWKEKSDEDVISLGPEAQATLVAHDRRGFFCQTTTHMMRREKHKRTVIKEKVDDCPHTKTT